ncbi:transcriptional regulator [Fischerella thermalis CCMEE 5201]|nr:transcriptional regulator [Fischerella thermalis CCMEE 5201]
MASSIKFSWLKKTVAFRQPKVSHLIHKLRQLTGLSQEQFADTLGVAFSTINRWENGHMQPSPLALKQIKAMLNDLSRSPVIELVEQSQILLKQYFSEAESRAFDE